MAAPAVIPGGEEGATFRIRSPKPLHPAISPIQADSNEKAAAATRPRPAGPNARSGASAPRAAISAAGLAVVRFMRAGRGRPLACRGSRIRFWARANAAERTAERLVGSVADSTSPPRREKDSLGPA